MVEKLKISFFKATAMQNMYVEYYALFNNHNKIIIKAHLILYTIKSILPQQT